MPVESNATTIFSDSGLTLTDNTLFNLIQIVEKIGVAGVLFLMLMINVVLMYKMYKSREKDFDDNKEIIRTDLRELRRDLNEINLTLKDLTNRVDNQRLTSGLSTNPFLESVPSEV